MYGTWPGSGKLLCSYNLNLDTCDYEDYFLTIALEYVLTGLLLGLGAVFMTVVTYIIYASCCCKFCQWCAWYGCSHYVIKGKFLKKGRLSKRYYNVLFHRARLYRVLSMAVSMLIVCFLFVTLGIEIKVETATATVRTRSETFALAQADVLEKAINRLQSLPSYQQFQSVNTAKMVANTKDYIQGFRDQVGHVDSVRSAELGKFIPEMFFIVILIALAICGMIVSLWGQRHLLLIYGVCVILALVPIFLYWSLTAGLETLFNDVCLDKDVSANNGNSALKYGIAKCNGTKVTELRTNLDRLYKEVEVKTCVNSQRMCIQPGVHCPATTCTLPTIGNIVEKTLITDSLACGSPNCTRACLPGETTCYVRNMTLPACTIACRNPQLRSMSVAARTLERDVIAFGQYYKRVFMPAVRCDFVDQFFQYIDRPLCNDMMKIGVAAVFILLIAILFFFQFFLILATHLTLEKKEKTLYEMSCHPDSK